MFRAAVAKAGGQLRSLNLGGQSCFVVPFSELREVIRTNQATLTELIAYTPAHLWTAEEWQALLDEAPF